ncbi:rhamnan synthesis F family protein [Roseomonas sp. HF4]|uniref:rhamnan synthesis F family protein n=1 Tax=Roseomonas sp. HF4 TaxID=2562313 RepID=UPI0010C09081|nr:rhamnan synthesis F family protein [Roseomonas sp. HF4]
MTGDTATTAPPAAVQPPQSPGPSVAGGPDAPLPVLTDITMARSGLWRLLHGLPPFRLPRFEQRGFRLPRRATLRRPWTLVPVVMAVLAAYARFAARTIRLLAAFLSRLVRRSVVWSVEEVRISILDASDRLRRPREPILRMEAGEDPCTGHASVALFVQFSPDGTLSAMVRRQIETYRRLGFATVVISNSPTFAEDAWQDARRLAALVVHRRNKGLDFGAWKDLMPVALRRWPTAEEVLLVNDSVLGPIRPLDPVFAAMRQAGPGFFGLLESAQGGPHLQTWFTLARGPKAIADLALFLRRLRLSRSKWRIIQRGELRLARHMLGAGNRVATVYGYRRLVDLAVADPVQRAYLDRAIPSWVRGVDASVARARLLARPVNPAHHLWMALSGPYGCPYIKTELIRRNPGGMPAVDRWPELVPAASPCPPEMLRAHLAGLGP